jgi:arylsulfatase
MVGKWHVTKHTRPEGDADKFNWPLQRGFDRYYGIINGASSLWDPNSLTRDNTPITMGSDPAYQPVESYHFTDAISDNAAMFIREHDGSKPFFMYVAYTAAHWPMHARERDIARYRGSYDPGYEPIRAARLARMKTLGVVKPNARLSPTVGSWDDVPDKEWEAACMEVYAAMIDQMDQGIGRIIGALKDQGEFDNTLILFLQDNGGCAEPYGRKVEGPRVERGADPSLPPIPDHARHYYGSTPEQTRDGWPVRRGHVIPGPADTAIGYGRNWANVSNTPHREYKHWVHEGGISTPLIAHWPAGFTATNELRHQPSHLIDLMATCVDVSRATYPARFHDEPIRPPEGLSLVPVFAGKSLDREALYWEHEGNRAVRMGDWKLVAKGRQGPWELYDIAQDRSELHDLAATHPELVQKLAEMWMRKAKATQVLPYPPSPKKAPTNPR